MLELVEQKALEQELLGLVLELQELELLVLEGRKHIEAVIVCKLAVVELVVELVVALVVGLGRVVVLGWAQAPEFVVEEVVEEQVVAQEIKQQFVA